MVTSPPFDLSTITMNQLINSVVESYCTESFAVTVAEAKELATQLGILPSLEDGLQEVAASTSNTEPDGVEGRLRHRMGLILDETLTGFGITLSDESSEEDLIKVLGWVKAIENTELSQDVIDTCNLPEDPEDIFAELVKLIDVPEYSFIESTVTFVNPDLIDAIEALHTGILKQEPTPTMDPAYSQTVRNAFGFIEHVLGHSHTQLLGYRLLKGGVTPGLPFEWYFTMAGGYLNPGYDKQGNKVEVTQSLDRYAAEYFALLMVGTDSCQEPAMFWRQNNNKWITDTIALSRIDALVMHYATLFENFLADLDAQGSKVMPADQTASEQPTT